MGTNNLTEHVKMFFKGNAYVTFTIHHIRKFCLNISSFSNVHINVNFIRTIYYLL